VAPELTRARAAAEKLFDATCTITADREGHTDDLFNEATGVLTRPPDDTDTIYSGPCLVRPTQGLGQNRRAEGDAEQFIDRYDLRLPVTATGLAPGQIVTIDSAPNDPDVVDQQFTVLQVAGGSHAITRIVTLQLRTSGPHV
jgi:hypothetical protein